MGIFVGHSRDIRLRQLLAKAFIVAEKESAILLDWTPIVPPN